jgi:rhodanese-related sulfurtransferase
MAGTRALASPLTKRGVAPMMKLIALAMVAIAWPAAAKAAPIDEMKAACYVGTEPVATAGSMPQHLDGVLTVSPREAKCAIDRFPQLLVIAPMRDLEQLPNAVPVPLLAIPALDAANEAKTQAALTELTAGDKSRPILVYCHHSSCGYSVEAAKHLHAWGYPNVLWMREGLVGWNQAGYLLTPIAKARGAVGEPSWTIWTKPAGDTTLACFGGQNLDACDLKVFALDRIFNAPDLPADQRDTVAGQLFNAAAVRAQVIREDEQLGGAAKALPESQNAYNALKQYAAQLGRPGVLAENAKVLREFALEAIETGKPAQAQALLREARADGEAAFDRLAAVRSSESERKSVFEAMVGMEHFERDIADFALDKAGVDNFGDLNQGAAPYIKLAADSLDRAALWIERNGKEGIGTQMDLHPDYRISEIMEKKGDIADKANDKAGARKAYGYAMIVCGLEDDSPNVPLFANTCERVSTKYYFQTPEFERWSAEQAKKEFDLYMSLLKD